MSDVITSLEKSLGGRVRRDVETLGAHRRDTWVLGELRAYEGDEGPLPAAVVEATSTEEVSETLRICRAERRPVITFGGGSGVCGGIRVPEGAVVLSTRKLAGLVALDSADLTASFRAGTMGGDAERRVREDGLTIGHWPQSIELSTVGGWVATRASGQYSTAYGNIEDLVMAMEVVLPDGQILRTRHTPRAAAGPDLRQLFMGSEGTLGVVTEVTFSLRDLPAHQIRQAFHFDQFHTAVEVIRLAMRAGWRPPVVRLYDARESRRHFRESCPKGRAMLIFLHEGQESAALAEASGLAELCARMGGEEADTAAVAHWFEQRNEVPSFRSFIEEGKIVDTVEVASTWQHLTNIYDAVTGSLNEVPGVLSATAHTSHAYRSGANLYFSFAVQPGDPADMGAAYEECWRRVMRATVENGGGIAHHHGIGRVRRDFMGDEVGEAGLDVLRSVKRALDPDDLLNPGNLLPPAGPGSSGA